MLNFAGPADLGHKNARMELRTSAEAKALISQAATLLGLNASEFAVSATTRAARETIQHYQTTRLQPEAVDAFMRAFEDEAPSAALSELMELHEEVQGGHR